MSETQTIYDDVTAPGRQPLPTPGQANVTQAARTAFNEMIDRREAEGIRKYGTTLQTHNGRDAHRDLAEELIDAWQYAKQAEMERADLEADARRFAAVLAAQLAPNGHLLWCMGTAPGELYAGEPCDHEHCPEVRAAVELARKRGYLAKPVEVEG